MTLMLLSHKHKFIYIKTRKTASSSTEVSLSRYCDGPHDVVTPMAREEESLRRPLGVVAKNYLSEWGDYDWYDWCKLAVRGRRKLRFWGHMTAHEIRERVPPDVWNTYFKFTFDRNPWDKTVSNYFWRSTRDREPMDLDEYFRRYAGRFPQFNYQYYSIGDALAVDFVGRFENLTRDLASALRRVGIEFDGWLPHAKGVARKDRRHYSQILNDEQRQLVARHFKQEIDLLGYRFEQK